jgi:hypothetical protein
MGHNFQDCCSRYNNIILLDLIGNWKMNNRTEARRIFCNKFFVGLFFSTLVTLIFSQPAFSSVTNCKPIDLPLTTEANIPENTVVQYQGNWHKCVNGFWRGTNQPAEVHNQGTEDGIRCKPVDGSLTTDANVRHGTVVHYRGAWQKCSNGFWGRTNPPKEEPNVLRQGTRGGFACKHVDGRLTTKANFPNGTVVQYRGSYHKCSNGFWGPTNPPAIVHRHGTIDGIRCKPIDLPLTTEANVRHGTVVQYRGNWHECSNGFWKGINEPGSQTTAGTSQEDDLDAFESSLADDSLDEFETEFANEQAEKRRQAELARIEAERQRQIEMARVEAERQREQARLAEERRLRAEREQARIQEAKRQREYRSRQEEYYEDEDEYEDSSSNVWGSVLQGLALGLGAYNNSRAMQGFSQGRSNSNRSNSRSPKTYGQGRSNSNRSNPRPPKTYGQGQYCGGVGERECQ